MKRADKHLEPCEDTECRYEHFGICSFGLRNSHGCEKMTIETELKKLHDREEYIDDVCPKCGCKKAIFGDDFIECANKKCDYWRAI